VDLIARRGRTLAFVEVKWRSTQCRLCSTLPSIHTACAGSPPPPKAMAARYARPGDTLRIDVLLLAPGRFPRHIATPDALNGACPT
jgi:putative endonuclease